MLAFFDWIFILVTGRERIWYVVLNLHRTSVTISRFFADLHNSAGDHFIISVLRVIEVEAIRKQTISSYRRIKVVTILARYN